MAMVSGGRRDSSTSSVGQERDSGNLSFASDLDDADLRAVERGESISTTLLNDVTILLATCILFKNWQRPGAVANVTLDEFKQAKLLTKGSPPVYLLSVREHKTAVEGYAKTYTQYY